MDSLGETLSLLTDSQLSFLDELEQLSIDQVQSTSSNKKENEDSLIANRLVLYKHFAANQVQIDEDWKKKLRKISDKHEYCIELQGLIDQVLQRLETLKTEYEFASCKTNQVHSTCEVILQQQNEVLNTLDKIEQHLLHFKRYDRLSIILQKPLNELLQQDLDKNLIELDECISYIQEHPQFLVANEYLEKFTALQNAVILTLKNHVILQLQMKTNQIVPQASDQISPGENVFTLFYGKFQGAARELSPLLAHIECRAHLDETSQNYLNECYQTYVNSRESLILPILTLAIQEMINANAHSTLFVVRSASRMVLHICRDEHHLYFNFFKHSSEQLSQLLDTLCGSMFDFLLPLIIKCNHLETLAEICSALRSVEEGDDLVQTAPEASHAFMKVVERLLQEIHERLIHRTNVFIQTDILGYVPVPGDLAYAEKLHALSETRGKRGLTRCDSNASIATIASTTLTANTLSDVSLMPFDGLDPSGAGQSDYHLWYPPVRRSIMCLTKLFHTLDTSIFQALAQDVITACIESLDSASSRVAAGTGSLDSSLFMIKHLLIIREQIAPFKIECTVREVSLDFSRVKDAAVNLLQKRGSIFSISTNNGLLSLLFEVQSSAQVIDQVLDSQKTVDTKIKYICEAFMDLAANQITQLIDPLKEKLKLSQPVTSDEIKEQSRVKEIENDLQALLNELQKKVMEVQSAMSLYLANEDTEAILFRPIKAKVLKVLESLDKQLHLVLNEAQLHEMHFTAEAKRKIFHN